MNEEWNQDTVCMQKTVIVCVFHMGALSLDFRLQVLPKMRTTLWEIIFSMWMIWNCSSIKGLYMYVCRFCKLMDYALNLCYMTSISVPFVFTRSWTHMNIGSTEINTLVMKKQTSVALMWGHYQRVHEMKITLNDIVNQKRWLCICHCTLPLARRGGYMTDDKINATIIG